MPNFYKFNFVQQVFPFDEEVKLYQGDSPLKFYALHKGGLGRYEYNNDTWKETMSMKDLHAQQVYFADVLGNGKLMLIAKTKEGISFYQHKNKEFSLIAKTENFQRNFFYDSYYGWNEPGSIIKFGHFYHNQSLF